MMIILTIRTDKPEAEIGLYEDKKRVDYVVWQAHRQLAETLHLQIQKLLADNSYELSAVKGIVCYAGPGSFTGLRIGLSVGNALSYALGAGVIATSGESWHTDGIQMLSSGQDLGVALPVYGADVHITRPRH